MTLVQKKINIFIPIEIKKRELISKVFLSRFIINNNKKKVRCYIGSKGQINKLILHKKNYGGVFIYKGGLPFQRMKALKKKVEKFILLDEELGPAVDIKKHIADRLWKGSEKFIDKLYYIGKHVSDISKKIYPRISNKIKMTGWPRVDLWRPEMQYIHKNDIKKLKKDHGKFILFSSDFTFNSISRINYEIRFWKNSEWKNMSKNLIRISNEAKKALNEYQENIKLIRELDKRLDIPQIIIRPHPADDLNEWKKIEKSLIRTKIIFDGDVSPWIYASCGVLHRGCTSAIEAYMAGIPTGYVITKKRWIRNHLPYKVSTHLENLDQIIKFCKNKKINNCTNLNKHQNEFKKFILVGNKYASEIIADDILSDELLYEKPCYYSKIKYMFDFLKVTLVKAKNHFIININKYLKGVLLPNKMQGGVNKKDILDILCQFEAQHDFKVKQVLTDCVEIEA